MLLVTVAGVILSIAGLSWMLYLSIASSDPWRIVASGVYGISLIALFLASTLYHAMHASPHKHIYKLLDHCAIYLLIAGSYTPFLLVAMRTDTGWWLVRRHMGAGNGRYFDQALVPASNTRAYRS